MAHKELRKSIFDVEDIPEEIVAVPEWNDTKVLVRGMNGKNRAEFLKRSTNPDGEVAFDRFYAELIIATAFDPEDGEKVFEAADRDAINAKSGMALERLARVAQRLSGLGATDLDEAKKDSDETPSNAST